MKDLLKARHIGVSEQDEAFMLQAVGAKSIDELIDQTIPASIRLKEAIVLPEPLTERQYAEHIADIASKNKLFTSYIGQGWYDTCLPAVIQRNIFENPSWYTSYTPYQAEISQGRLEALLNFQTAVSDFTGMPLANASLLDEATAAAEAATMMLNLRSREQVKNEANILFVDQATFPSVLAVLRTRAEAQGIKLEIGDFSTYKFTSKNFGAIVQYPNANGNIENYSDFVAEAHAIGAKVAVDADILSLALLTPPGEWGADIVFGSTQRWGIPMGFGGPSAAYFATRDEFKRDMPGRIIGISKDANGKTALRMALQTREQHIKREKATSNICTAQALLASMAGMYTVYHGAEGIKAISQRIHAIATYINEILPVYGYTQENESFFDTLKISLPEEVSVEDLKAIALDYEVNFRYFETGEIGISFDETTDIDDVNTLIEIFATSVNNAAVYASEEDLENLRSFDESFERSTPYLTNEVFNLYRSETEMMRYIKKLERRDISLTHSMISLGSCTMKLNAASEMLPMSRPEFGGIHPLAPADQTEGYNEMISELEKYLTSITGFAACSLQPNSGAAGEYTGLMVIREHFKSKGETQRDTLLIPASAHGTNPASAAQAGFKIVVVKCDEGGNTDWNDWKEKAEANKDRLAGCMITYPSTHGIFEERIKDMCEAIHANGGQVYMDGANMNAQVGLTNPGTIGADVCHLNLHKTFAIPHGGGGPGVGPICVAEHLAAFLPSKTYGKNTVSAAPYGSASVTAITYGYIRMMGEAGLTHSTKIAILNANYLAARLKDSYGVLYTGENGRVGHELILEARNFKATSGVTETDIAKRLMDYGFHAPTLSFPVHGTLMIEPTESESLAELNRFADAMLQIFDEIKEVENGTADKTDNVLLNSPHPEYSIVSDEWNHSYSRTKAAYPTAWVAENKFWVNVARVDNAYGDRNLICTCQAISTEE
ncbi:glycine dehydrogenase (decarboxylating) beta subunit; glycine dehydrogenase (decarboxylating) alpha subunit [Paludibacter propionicigenes WB4]|uniref:Glycine dehydrogenase (decarboxylating) n=1 Tax=Paludibacter propionicigenes (strain DSM 17365 / JCM 13257 / WB4) TaxID=694427 RepID=E4T069_PALPW|nr:aminomethyl-transferring glycine dehydrogenase [Paludibacter propionicigenes]ADQ78259.1 glycine dehydrogenase (decarboxylating) beta subunit; glycine dehydrogenase (decarboxylating) alpha subunit [Paludibacter propionicigenes WB4]